MPLNSRLGRFLPYRLAITSHAVTGHIASRYGARFGLKIAEWRVMMMLGDSGALTQRALVTATHMDKVTVNRACRTLDDRGLVRRSPNFADGRSHHLELTDAGQMLFDQMWPQAQAAYEAIFAALTVQQADTLRALLDMVYTSVRRIEAGAPGADITPSCD